MTETRWIYRGQDGRMCGFFSPDTNFPAGTHHLESVHVYTAEQHAEAEKLRAFVAEVMDAWPEDGIDGEGLQEAGIKYGLLTLKSPNPTEPCGENCGCAEYVYANEFARGVECYERTYKKGQ